MSRRNSIRKRLEHHRATVAAERSREVRRATLQLRKAVKIEASKLAGELERVVLLQPESTSNASAGETVNVVADHRSQSPAVDSFMGRTHSEGKIAGRIRKNNAERRKAAVRRKKIESRLKERMERDVDMFEDEDEVSPAATFKFAVSSPKHEIGEGCTVASTARKPGTDREIDVKNSKAAKTKVKCVRKSLAKQRREDRKRKLQILMRESINALGHDDSSQ